MSDTKDYIRVIFVGDSGVGKTALINRYMEDEFSEETTSTMNPQFASAVATTINGDEINLQLWDTAGQEKFQSLSVVFYRDANIAIICFDASAENSYESIGKWKNQVLEYCPDCQIILAVTKLDLIDMEQRSDKINQWNELSQQNGLEFMFLTSAKTYEGFKELFTQIATVGDGIIHKKDAPPKPHENTVRLSPSNNNPAQRKKDKACCK